MKKAGTGSSISRRGLHFLCFSLTYNTSMDSMDWNFFWQEGLLLLLCIASSYCCWAQGSSLPFVRFFANQYCVLGLSPNFERNGRSWRMRRYSEATFDFMGSRFHFCDSYGEMKMNVTWTISNVLRSWFISNINFFLEGRYDSSIFSQVNIIILSKLKNKWPERKIQKVLLWVKKVLKNRK